MGVTSRGRRLAAVALAAACVFAAASATAANRRRREVTPILGPLSGRKVVCGGWSYCGRCGAAHSESALTEEWAGRRDVSSP